MSISYICFLKNIFMVIPDFGDPAIWVSLLTLCFLEIVLGIDNIIFISIVSDKLPEKQKPRARNLGLLLAMVFRVGLLLMITSIIKLTYPVITLGFIPTDDGTDFFLSWKDIILIAGGIFLLTKSTLEIHHKLELHTESSAKPKFHSFAGVILQIILVDAVFSFDSILTAVGLVENVLIMIIAVVVSILVMMLFAGKISTFINNHPTLQMLALAFLILIGVMLIAEGFHQHISKGYIYSAIAFSLVVEMLNMKLRKNSEQIQLNKSIAVKSIDIPTATNIEEQKDITEQPNKG